jgi:hypothetical protein
MIPVSHAPNNLMRIADACFLGLMKDFADDLLQSQEVTALRSSSVDFCGCEESKKQKCRVIKAKAI